MSRFRVPLALALLLIPLLIGLTACGGVAASPVQPTPQPTPAPQPAPQPAAAPTVTSFTATPTTVMAGQLSNLQWTTTGATSVSISNLPQQEDNQALPLSNTSGLPVMPTTTTTYTLTATGPGGPPATASVTVTVTQPAATISSFTASPTSVLPGKTSNLSWTVTNAKSISIDNGVTGTLNLPTGNISTPALNQTTTFTLTAIGLDGSTAPPAQATVTVETITLSASPTSVGSGGTSTLTWASQGASSVTIEPQFGTVNLSGSAKTQPLTQTTTFTATATDASGNQQTASATVTVVPSNGLQTIKHIIFFVQENRSFDNYFGHLGEYKASKGFTNDVDGTPANASQPDTNGTIVPAYHYQTVCVENTSPSWNPSWYSADWQGYTTQPGPGVNGQILVGGTPKMDNFIRNTDSKTSTDPLYHRVMGYYDQTDLPYYYEAATQFATSDRWFAPVMAGTIPNRMYLFTGTSFGHIFPDPPPPGGWTQPTIFDQLNKFGVGWKYYYQDDSIFLSQWANWNDSAVSGHVFPISDWYNILASSNADNALPSVVFIERASTKRDGLPDNLIGLDEHPGGNIQAGAADAAQIINALMASPAWQSSVLILTYDEPGGLYEHVPNLAGIPAPDNIAPIASSGFEVPLPGDFVHSGFRIPLIVFSPWVKKNFVSHTNRDFTSILKLIEARFGLPSLTGRDAWADDMSEFFDFTNPSWLTPPPLPPQPTNGNCNFSDELLGSQ